VAESFEEVNSSPDPPNSGFCVMGFHPIPQFVSVLSRSLIMSKELVRIENTYFKANFGEGAFMSGLEVPDLRKGPYLFVNCTFHCRLDEWKAMAKEFGCRFENCD
jgi:hypothetical protein